MNKKGFTLIEVIGVVIILSLIALVAFPKVLNAIQSSKNELSESTKNLIYTASSQYINHHINDFPKTTGNVYCIALQELVNEDLLTSSIQNENLGAYGLQTKVKVTINNDKYEYVIDNTCVEVN